MPKIHPFKALLYSPEHRPEIGKLIAPPYDVISPDGFQSLKKLHRYQSVQLALTENPDDPERYQKMKSLFDRWKKDKVLALYPEPAFYLIEDRFQSGGKESKRVGFVALLSVSPFEDKEILPHEHTLSGPKKDRLELLKTMRAEVSQIFLCYQDPKLTLEKIYETLAKEKPLMEGLDSSKIHRRVWAISDKAAVKNLQDLVGSRPALIADGHHRYETAVNFRDQAPLVQVYFTNLNTPGFSILPIHRLFSLPMPAAAFLDALSKDYQITEWKTELSIEALEQEKKSGDLKLFCALPGKNYLLTQKPKSKTDAEIFSIHRDIFEKILGWNVKELSKGTIHYEHETSDFLARLKSLSNGAGLYLPPTDLKIVMELSQKGERMPQKSTFFYPKLASGLINFDLDQH